MQKLNCKQKRIHNHSLTCNHFTISNSSFGSLFPLNSILHLRRFNKTWYLRDAEVLYDVCMIFLVHHEWCLIAVSVSTQRVLSVHPICAVIHTLMQRLVTRVFPDGLSIFSAFCSRYGQETTHILWFQKNSIRATIAWFLCLFNISLGKSPQTKRVIRYWSIAIKSWRFFLTEIGNKNKCESH